MYLIGHTDPTLTMRVYQQVIDMGEGGLQTLEQLIGWQNHRFAGRAAFVVELAPGPLPRASALRHARAIRRLAVHG